MANPNHSVSLTDADRVAIHKIVPPAHDRYMQDLLLQHYPTGLPPGFGSWSELLFNVLGS
jgi:hypothetical protein